MAGSIAYPGPPEADVRGPPAYVRFADLGLLYADRGHRLIEDRQRRVGLLRRQHQRRRQADGVAAGAEHQQAAREALPAPARRARWWRAPWSARSRTSSMPIISPRPRTSPIDRMLVHQRLRARHHVRADRRRRSSSGRRAAA